MVKDLSKLTVEQIIEFLSYKTKLSKEDIEKKIQDRSSGFKSFHSKKAAALLVADDHGIDLHEINDSTVQKQQPNIQKNEYYIIHNVDGKTEKLTKTKLEELQGTSPIMVYVLECEPGNHYYIGFSAKFAKMVLRQFMGKGTQFTRYHRALSLVSYQSCQTKDEAKKLVNKLTLTYMADFGIECVAGGAYSQSLAKYKPPVIELLDGRRMLQIKISVMFDNDLIFEDYRYVNMMKWEEEAEEMVRELKQEQVHLELPDGGTVRLQDCTFLVQKNFAVF